MENIMHEINMWINPTNGSIYGNLTNKKTRQFQNFSGLLPITKFCNLSFEQNLMTVDELANFINDPTRDHAALYAWTKDKATIISWRRNATTALYIQNNVVKELRLIEHRYTVKGQPDMCFR